MIWIITKYLNRPDVIINENILSEEIENAHIFSREYIKFIEHYNDFIQVYITWNKMRIWNKGSEKGEVKKHFNRRLILIHGLVGVEK